MFFKDPVKRHFVCKSGHFKDFECWIYWVFRGKQWFGIFHSVGVNKVGKRSVQLFVEVIGNICTIASCELGNICNEQPFFTEQLLAFYNFTNRLSKKKRIRNFGVIDHKAVIMYIYYIYSMAFGAAGIILDFPICSSRQKSIAVNFCLNPMYATEKIMEVKITEGMITIHDFWMKKSRPM